MLQRMLTNTCAFLAEPGNVCSDQCAVKMAQACHIVSQHLIQGNATVTQIISLANKREEIYWWTIYEKKIVSRLFHVNYLSVFVFS